MNRFKGAAGVSVILVMLAFSAASAQTAKNKQPSDAPKQSIEVVKFDLKEGVEFPAAKIDVMMTEIVDELLKTKKFSRINLNNPSPEATAAKPDPEAEKEKAADEVSEAKKDEERSDLVLTGTITDYKPGNRAARWAAGIFGAGRSRVAAMIKLTDRETGKVLVEREVDGNVMIGVFGGNSNETTRGLAIEVAKVLKRPYK